MVIISQEFLSYIDTHTWIQKHNSCAQASNEVVKEAKTGTGGAEGDGSGGPDGASSQMDEQ